MEDTPPSHLSRPRPWEVGRCAKIHQKLEHVNFPRFFNFFFTFFYHFACKDAKIHQKLEKSNFPRFFLHFLHVFLHFACRVPNFPNLGEFWHPASKMIKTCKKNVKNSRKIENSPKIGNIKFSSSFLHFCLHFFCIFLSFCLQGC